MAFEQRPRFSTRCCRSGPFHLITSGRRSLLSAAPISRLRRARGAQESGTILFFGFWRPWGQISVRSPPGIPAGAHRAPEDWGALVLKGKPLILGSSGTIPSATYFQKRTQQLSGQGNDQYLPDLAAIELDPLMEPLCQYRTRLMSHPQPGKLDHRCSQPRVPGFGDALFVSDGPALPRRRRQPRISSDPWILERSATGLRELDLNVLSKLGNQGLEGRLEPEAFTGGEVGGEDDLLDFLVGCPVYI